MTGSVSSSLSSSALSQLSQLFSVNSPSSQSGGESLKDVIAKLAAAVTGQDGKLDTSSPLGKMLEQFVKDKTPDGLESLMGGDVASHMTPDGIQKAMGDMIKDKLGENFGAASNLPGGGSGGFGGTSGTGGSSGTSGQGDLMSQVLGGLGKSQMDGMLTDNASRGGSDFKDSDKAALTEVARFMDQHPETFGKPDDANGKVGSWADEINNEGDTYLNQDETDKFRGAMDEIGQQMQSGNAQNAGLLGGGSGLDIGDSNSGGGGLGGGPSASGNQGTGGTSSQSSSIDSLISSLEQTIEQAVVSSLQSALGSLSGGGTGSTGGTDDSSGTDSSSPSGNDSSKPAGGHHFGPHAHGGQGGVSHGTEQQSLQNDAQLAAGNVLSKLLG